MMQNLLDPVIIFFLMGIVATLLRVSLSINTVIYETISIYLLLSIGLKGGFELNKLHDFSFIFPFIASFGVGAIVPTFTFIIAKIFYAFSRENAVALAAHYGAASAVTFAVVLNYLDDNGLSYEKFTSVFLIIIEITGILIAFCFLHLNPKDWWASIKKIIHDVLLNKSIFLLLMGLCVGWISSVKGFKHVEIVFIDLFKGILCFFMLEMGLVCGQQIQTIRNNKAFIVLFGLGMPLFAGVMGIVLGKIAGLSVAGTTVLATIAASASYIAAPAVTRSIIPQANLSIPLACALGITFPFNVIIGIPLYYFLAEKFYLLF